MKRKPHSRGKCTTTKSQTVNPSKSAPQMLKMSYLLPLLDVLVQSFV